MRAFASTSLRQDDHDLQQELWYAWVHSSLTPQHQPALYTQLCFKTNNVSAIDISINGYVLALHQKCPSLLHEIFFCFFPKMAKPYPEIPFLMPSPNQ